jgi:hypothetical protein
MDIVNGHVMTEPTTKTRAEIETEKASKPRVDLIPATALAAIGRALERARERGEYRGGPLELLATGARERDADTLADAWLAAAILLSPGESFSVAVGRGLLAAGEVMAVGLRKHGKCTWRMAGTEQADPQCHYASACRHTAEELAGLERDPDSGRRPAVHMLTQIPILIDLLVDPPMIAGENDGHAMLPPPPVPVTP